MFVFHWAICLLRVSETKSRGIEGMHSTKEVIKWCKLHIHPPAVARHLAVARSNWTLVWSFLLVSRVHMQLVYSAFMMDLCVNLISSYSYQCSVCSEIIRHTNVPKTFVWRVDKRSLRNISRTCVIFTENNYINACMRLFTSCNRLLLLASSDSLIKISTIILLLTIIAPLIHNVLQKFSDTEELREIVLGFELVDNTIIIWVKQCPQTTGYGKK